jgi:hypothetical protein
MQQHGTIHIAAQKRQGAMSTQHDGEREALIRDTHAQHWDRGTLDGGWNLEIDYLRRTTFVMLLPQSRPRNTKIL